MNTNTIQTLDQIKRLFRSQAFAVLSTQQNGQPYANLVAFTSSDDLRQIIFLTPSTTRKYENLTKNPKVAVLVDNTRNKADDVSRAVCVTATGTALVIPNQSREKLLRLFLLEHPYLSEFANAPETVLVCVQVETFFVVKDFQNVEKIQLSP